MKKVLLNTKTWASALLFLVFTSCSESFLEKEPLGLLTSANFFTTEDHAIQATNAVYSHLRDWEVHVFAYIGVTDIASDDSDKGSTPTDANFLLEVDDFTFDAGNLAFSTVWRGYYKGIYRANLCIENIPNIEMNEALRDRLVAENKFLRAYFYLNLVRWFGGVPLILQPLEREEYNTQTRATVDQVYAQIEQDLKDALEVLPEKNQYQALDLGRATKGAARGMLARMYLSRGDWANASLYAKQVIESNQYALYSNYGKIFTREGEHSSESLFEVGTASFTTGGGGSQYNEVQGVRGTPNLGWGFNRPSDNLVSSYEPGDPRRDATVLYVGEVLPDGSAVVEDNPQILNERYNQKAWFLQPEAGGNGNGGGNIRILRYADVLLMYAEAQNELGNAAEALIYLNQVRARARGLNPNLLRDVTVTDQTQLRERIWRERRSELAMEQIRLFDLQRQGRAATVLQALGKSYATGKNELFPIPQTEIDLSGGNLTQNPGY